MAYQSRTGSAGTGSHHLGSARIQCVTASSLIEVVIATQNSVCKERGRDGRRQTVAAALPRVDNRSIRTPRAVLLSLAAVIMVQRLLPIGIVQHVIYHRNNLLAYGGSVVPVGQLTQPQTAAKSFRIKTPLVNITSVDAVTLPRNRQVGRTFRPCGIGIKRYQRVCLLEHPVVHLLLRVIRGRSGLVGLRARHVTESVRGKHRRTKHNGTPDQHGIQVAVIHGYLVHLVDVGTQVIEMTTPHRVTVHAQKLPALAVRITTRLAFTARRQRLRQIDTVLGVVVAQLRGIETSRRNSLIHRNGDRRVLAGVHIQKIFATGHHQHSCYCRHGYIK